MDQRSWIATGRRLGQLSRVSNWWIGDWLRFGTAKWGQKYIAAAKITGYDAHSLENMVYVASRIESSLRRENLSWSHHALVAALDSGEREQWLNLAVVRRLSVADLRIELRAAQRALKSSAASDSQPEGQVASLICPHCGRAISLNSGSLEPLDISVGSGADGVGSGFAITSAVAAVAEH